MFTKIKPAAAKTALISLLSFIADSTKQFGFAYAPEVEADKLYKAEPTFITIDKTAKNAEGQVKVIATQVAIDALAAGESTEVTETEAPAPVAPVVPTVAPLYKLVTLAAIPDIMRGSNKTGAYPFPLLTVFPAEGSAFEVPVTATRANPAKAMASTVASANKRFPEKTFTVRKWTEGDTLMGAYVIRVK